ncbi:hypothetical protein F2Q68_00034623 [Brassica cretica]|uniref:Uncharacterized protein n=1 Tax=Brassica cretica TaxID=69181 RepID=A0A8S9H2D8_BRACR|nr:hypothetical protein F2Q68_00034623 [Brassica cretica]
MSIDGSISLSSNSYVIRIGRMWVSWIDAPEILSIDLDWGPSIDVHSLAAIDTNAIRRNSSDFLLRNLPLAASLPSPLARNHPQ